MMRYVSHGHTGDKLRKRGGQFDCEYVYPIKNTRKLIMEKSKHNNKHNN